MIFKLNLSFVVFLVNVGVSFLSSSVIATCSLGSKCTVGYTYLNESYSTLFIFFSASLATLILEALGARIFSLTISIIRRIKKFGHKEKEMYE